MYEIPIDFKRFYKEFGIKIKNPIHKSENRFLKNKLMIYLREHYVKHRKLYKIFFPENGALSILLDSNNTVESKSYKFSCAAEQQVNLVTGEAVQPFYYLESIQVVDILPKEYIPQFRKCIKKIIEKNQGKGFNSNHAEEASFDDYKKVHNSFFEFCVASFSVKSNSKLGEYVSGVNIEMVSMSASFVGLICKFYINHKWKEKIKDLCIADRKNHSFYFGMEKLKVYQFRQIELGNTPGYVYKQELLEVLLEEIKYRICKEFFKDLNTVIFLLYGNLMAVNVFETNINSGSSKYFWKSIGVEAQACNYLKGQTHVSIHYIEIILI